jgi:ribose transport system substrate-binding protein
MKIVISVFFCIFELFAYTYKIGFAQDTLANDWRKAQVDEAILQTSKYDFLTIDVKDAKGEVSKQILHIDEFIDKRYDFIVTSPIDATLTAAVTQKAIDKNIKVILISRGVDGEGYTTFIAPDNEKIARQAAEFMVKKMGAKGVILMLEGVEGATTTLQRRRGFEAVIAKYPQMSIIYRRGNFLRNDTMKVMEELYAKNIAFDAIYSHSDSMLEGARQVMDEHGDSKEMITVGIDFIQSAKKAILQGKQTASFTYPTAAKEGIEAIVSIIKNKPVLKNQTIDSTMVTIQNVHDVRPIF